MELKARRSGFSLIEVMIALTILGFGLLTASFGQLTAIRNSGRSRTQTSAMYLAQQQMETFQTMPSADVVAAVNFPTYTDDTDNPIDPNPGGDDATQFNRRWLVRHDFPEPRAFTIRVEVAHVNSLGSIHTTVLESLKAEL